MTNGDELVPMVDEKSEVVETSKPAGGVTVTPAVMLKPDTVKLPTVAVAVP
jgi:hypothetical protein